MRAAYRLIWFQHFHKAAGTAIVDLAKLNSEKFWPNHVNGNPVDNSGKQIELWKYSASELGEFIDQCEQDRVTFVATEWGLPNIEVLETDQRVCLVSCMREPLARFVSNFYFDLYHGFTQATSLESYIGSRRRTITMHNYYCRILSGHQNDPLPVDGTIFARANQALDKFDHCVRLQDGIEQLPRALGWNISTPGSHKTRFGARQVFSHLLRGKWKLLYFRWRYPYRPASTAFAEKFSRDNDWDFQLYNSLNSL